MLSSNILAPLCSFHCRGVSSSIIGSHSCNGTSACRDTSENTIIYYGSCTGNYACAYMSEMSHIKQSSCGGDSACRGLIRGDIGIDACNGVHACWKDTNLITGASVTINDGACNGCYACKSIRGMFLCHDFCCLNTDYLFLLTLFL